MEPCTDLAWSAYTRTLRIKGRAETTITDYRYSYRVLTEWLGKPASEATRLEIEAWLESRLGNVSKTRVAQDQVNLRVFFKWAAAEDIIPSNPMERIPRITAPKAERRVMDDDELAKLLKACKGKSFNDLRDTAIIETLCLIGTPRMGELLTIPVTGVNLRNDLLALDGKTGTRAIPMGDRCGLAMERYLIARNKHRFASSEFLWIGKQGPLKRTGLRLMLNRRVRAAGLSGRIFPHLFRHTTAAKASAAGLSDSTMEMLYGWVDGSLMTRHYGRQTRAQRAQEAARAVMAR